MSVKKLLPYLLEFVHPQSVVEVGCGEGELLEGFQQSGARIQGIDAEEYVQSSFWQENKDFFMSANLEKVRISCQSKFDLAVCLECAHKFPEERAKTLIHDICLLSDVVMFSAGVPGQENDTANGQMPSYWAKLFQQNGFVMLDCLRAKIWEDKEIDAVYRQNVLLYVKEEALAKYPNLLKFYMNHGEDSLHDIVHPEFLKSITGKLNLHVMSPKKDRVAIVCKMNVWEDLFDFIDTDEIEICACFGNWKHIPEILREELKNKFYPIEEFFQMIDPLKPDYYIMKCGYGDMSKIYYPKMHSLGIRNEQIVNLELYLGMSRYMGLMYYYQWRYLLKHKPDLDFIATGGSITKIGLNLEFMLPYKGVKLAMNSQDIYYQYKMAESYLNKCVPLKNNIKFALIDVSMRSLYVKLNKDGFYFNELAYFPIIAYEDLEYKLETNDRFLKKILTQKSIKWLDKEILKIKNFSADDRDGQCASMDFNATASWGEVQKNGQKQFVFPLDNNDKEILTFNIDVLHKYVMLCKEYEIVPVFVRYPFATTLTKEVPTEFEKKYFDVLEEFNSDVRFIDLFGLDIPDEYTSDFFHLNSKGRKVATEALKEEINKIINE